MHRLILVTCCLCVAFCGVREAAGEGGRAFVAEGMSREEVIEAWGEPSGRIERGDVEILHYSRQREVELRGGQVSYVTGSPSAPAQERISQVSLPDLPMDVPVPQELWEDGTMPHWLPLLVAGLVLFLGLLMLVAWWVIYVKAGEPGWASLVPIYNLVVLLRIAGKPLWWFLLLLVPLVHVIVWVLLLLGLADRFGKGAGFAFGLLFFPLLFFPILAFGNAQHESAV